MLKESFQKSFSAESINYPLDTSHLAELDISKLKDWKRVCKDTGSKSLDCLYEQNPIRKERI